MIKKLLTIASFVMGSTMVAQQLPNSGYETWAPMNYNPTNWGTWDEAVAGLIGPTGTVTKSTSANSGSFALQIESKFVGAFQDTIPGVAISGSMALNASFGIDFIGSAYSGSPTSFSFYYKLTGVTDTAAAEAYFTKWNTTTNTRDTVGYGGDLIFMAPAYTQKQIPVMLMMAPDTVTVYIISAIGNTPTRGIGTILTVDDFSMNTPQSINNMEFEKSFNAYPNPASSAITIFAKTETKASINVFDLTGRNIGTFDMDSYKKVINLDNFENGLYIYNVIDSNKKVLHTGKFSVSK